MRRVGEGNIFRHLLGFVVILLSLSESSYGAVLYKNYIVRQDRGREILCEPYTVQKDDYVIKLFQEKGEISEKDFPEFLDIFRRLNPGIRNINRILPGQRLLIPLRKLQMDALPGQATGIVTIPFVTLSDVTELLKSYSKAHVVQSGDSVSVLIARRFGGFGSRSYTEGIELFKFMNPNVKNLDHIFLGQRLRLPDPSLRDEPWFPSLLDDSGRLTNQILLKDFIVSNETAMAPASPDTTGSAEPVSGMSRVAQILNAKLLDKGSYFFPGKDGKDLELDLSRFPVMQLEDGSRILFPREYTISEADLATVKSYWHRTSTIQVPSETAYEGILDAIVETARLPSTKSDLSFADDQLIVDIHARWIFEEPSADGEPMRHICVIPRENSNDLTPDSIIRYLSRKNIIIKDSLQDTESTVSRSARASDGDMHLNVSAPEVAIQASDSRLFVAELLKALRYSYSPEGQITFPYAGLQIKTVSSIVLKPDGNPLLIDFGEFFGDAISALTKSGFEILRVAPEDTHLGIAEKLLGALDVSFTENAVFTAVKEPGEYSISFTIPGRFVPEARASGVLISNQILPGEIARFLNDENIIVLSIETD